MTIAVVGAGFSGAVIARELAESGHQVQIFEARSHVAGNCHTERDEKTGILMHVYGPHIFHTPDEEVWQYVNRFSQFRPYRHSVRANTARGVYSLPINLLTINQFFGTRMQPAEAADFILERTESGSEEPRSFEEQALSFVGRELYENFFKGYTVKQWGIAPSELPASILKRLPLRFNYDDSYFSHPYQGMPEAGYTALIERMLDHEGIAVSLDTPFHDGVPGHYEHVFYSGTIDGYFNYDHGRLAYRTLDFEKFYAEGDYQGCAVMNYCEEQLPYTRVSEHKHFSPWEQHEQTVCYRECSRDCDVGDIPYYPLHQLGDNERLNVYLRRAGEVENVTFVGRLGTYQYLDMDACVRAALDVVRSSGFCVPQ